MMAVPLLHEDRALGVLQRARPARTTRRSASPRWSCSALFANQAAIALELASCAAVGRATRSTASGADLGAVASFAATLDALPEERRDAGLRLLAELQTILTN